MAELRAVYWSATWHYWHGATVASVYPTISSPHYLNMPAGVFVQLCPGYTYTLRSRPKPFMCCSILITVPSHLSRHSVMSDSVQQRIFLSNKVASLVPHVYSTSTNLSQPLTTPPHLMQRTLAEPELPHKCRLGVRGLHVVRLDASLRARVDE